MTYDEKVYALAESFLEDNALLTTVNCHQLAQEIQRTIDSFIEELEEEKINTDTSGLRRITRTRS
ncbi:MAG: hypothetical protein MN733_18150 [Nitrososphaera sp.]|nr:hypothetical protein [Nitrososphaera sp.]